MQLIVIGMHRSGTSAVTRLINLMGAYFGPENSAIGANDENPKGFWERRDLLDLDKGLLTAAGADWHQVGDFTLDRIPAPYKASFRKKAARLVLGLDAHRPWVIKEPRLCLLFPLWRELLEVPLVIYVHRHPLQIARSLQQRNGFPLAFGLALWERYTLDALQGLSGLPTLPLLQADLARDPVATTYALYGRLLDLEVKGLHEPSKREIQAFFDTRLFHFWDSEDLDDPLLSEPQRALTKAIVQDFDGLVARSGGLTLSTRSRQLLQAGPPSPTSNLDAAPTPIPVLSDGPGIQSPNLTA